MPTPTVATAHIDVGGVTRDYLVATPPDVASRDSLPLLLVLHGATQTMNDAESLGYDPIAGAGAVVVYPQGEKDPDDPSRPGYIWNSGQTDTGFDDVAFISDLIHQAQTDYAIDPNRVFIAGASNGGQMAYRAACELSDRIAAVADVIGALLVDCNPSQPVSVIDIHGAVDRMMPVDGGGEGCLPKTCPALADTMERWRQIDGCTGEPTATNVGTAVETTWADCAHGTAVTFILSIWGHDWTTMDPDDRAVTWAFFMNHPRSVAAP